jgi:hypothetical protein
MHEIYRMRHSLDRNVRPGGVVRLRARGLDPRLGENQNFCGVPTQTFFIFLQLTFIAQLVSGDSPSFSSFYFSRLYATINYSLSFFVSVATVIPFIPLKP